LLRGGFKEGATLQTTGIAEIPLPDDHPAAFLILLNVVHGHTRRVPRQVDLRMLTRIAILVDKYQLHEALEMFTDIWCENMKGSIPQSFTDDSMAAICIYWVFGKSPQFKQATQIVQMESKGRVNEEGLPIPSSIIGKNWKSATAFQM
jgi:hypothetical protein